MIIDPVEEWLNTDCFIEHCICGQLCVLRFSLRVLFDKTWKILLLRMSWITIPAFVAFKDSHTHIGDLSIRQTLLWHRDGWTCQKFRHPGKLSAQRQMNFVIYFLQAIEYIRDDLHVSIFYLVTIWSLMLTIDPRLRLCLVGSNCIFLSYE